ncbi:MAG: uracil-DNA glycosylase [Microscillaceae bacterium]|jgi:uracil-DNA glycosylase|nr:uracil-DNA glycosylase [Microscillaceae bacterium]
MEVKIAESWKNHLEAEFSKPYFAKLVEFVKEEYKNHTIYPPGRLIFNAFDKCAFDDLKVVIIGQDPYHGAGQANGLCFGVNDGVSIPASLRNIFKEINQDVGKAIPKSGNLERWAEQGVLLLNAVLTVREATPGSHAKKGWEDFTDAIIHHIAENKTGIVYMLWGSYAQKKGEFIDTQKNLVLKAGHPSPLNKTSPFGGCKHFSQANAYLKMRGETEIDW